MPHKDPEAGRAYRKKRREDNKWVRDNELKYNKEHREQRNAYASRYREENPEKIKASNDAQYEKNGAAIRAASSAYRKANPDKVNALSAKHHALKIAATVGDLAEIAEIYRQASEDEGIVCYLCGEVIPMGDREVDHVHPLSKGGAHSAENLKVTHWQCNRKKGSSII